ncbi:MAG TPA: hypothetical protein VIN40_06085 [Candidatus Tyrphobacter sp.]
MSALIANLNRGLRALFVFAYVFTLLGGRAQAQHVLPVLGTAPLLGQMSSVADLQQRVSERRAMFETASEDLGLTGSETSQLEARIASGQVRWVRVPRHLDAMTWAWDGSVYMYRDVLIPGGQYGWEVDLQVGSNVHALFIPAACGNLSLVERTVQVSYAPPPPPPPPQPQCPNGMMGSPPNCYAPQCPNGMLGSPPNCYAPPPQATPPPSITTVVVRTEVRESVAWWMIPLAFVGFFFGGHCHCGPPPPPPPPIKCPPKDPP